MLWLCWLELLEEALGLAVLGVLLVDFDEACCWYELPLALVDLAEACC
jgi:hypothetical protein